MATSLIKDIKKKKKIVNWQVLGRDLETLSFEVDICV